jgi:hypothetical protein
VRRLRGLLPLNEEESQYTDDSHQNAAEPH